MKVTTHTLPADVQGHELWVSWPGQVLRGSIRGNTLTLKVTEGDKKSSPQRRVISTFREDADIPRHLGDGYVGHSAGRYIFASQRLTPK